MPLLLTAAPASLIARSHTRAPSTPFVHTSLQPPMATYQPGVYLKFDEMEALMKAWAAAHPEIATLESIGTTHGSETTGPGHPIWLLTLTDSSTGTHDTKPAFWCDGNTHAGEVTGCQACLHLAHTLLTSWEEKDERTELLMATSTVYILPRISADGAELYLTTPHTCRSSPMFWPEPEPSPGLQPKDMTGDGDLLLMRIPHSAGSFKASKKDPRISECWRAAAPTLCYVRVWALLCMCSARTCMLHSRV
jgi:hypothetical protein